MEPTVSSETSANRTQTPENYPKRNKLHLEHGESLKTRTLQRCLGQNTQNNLQKACRDTWYMSWRTMLLHTLSTATFGVFKILYSLAASVVIYGLQKVDWALRYFATISKFALELNHVRKLSCTFIVHVFGYREWLLLYLTMFLQLQLLHIKNAHINLLKGVLRNRTVGTLTIGV